MKLHYTASTANQGELLTKSSRELLMAHYRGTTRQQAEQAGIALPKKVYQCGPCGKQLTHDESGKHFFVCPQRNGSTVKVKP